MIYPVVRAAGFRLDPERAHGLALRLARAARPWWSLRRRRHADRPVEAFGLAFRNPLGLAAGYDKDARSWRALSALGFGHIEVGTVTPNPQPGNPRPRLDRLPARRALVNRLGFPSDGAEAVAGRLSAHRPHGVVVGVSIGPNSATPPARRIDDYRLLVERFGPLADYLAVNVSSPNTPDLRGLEAPGALAGLLAGVIERRDAVARSAGRPVPILVKLSPDHVDLEAAVSAVSGAGAEGVIVGNTTTRRGPDLAGMPHGGLSGEPLGPRALDALRRVVAATDLPVVACGGVMSAADARERLDCGATLVQVFTGLVYRGPRLVHEVLDG